MARISCKVVFSTTKKRGELLCGRGESPRFRHHFFARASVVNDALKLSQLQPLSASARCRSLVLLQVGACQWYFYKTESNKNSAAKIRIQIVSNMFTNFPSPREFSYKRIIARMFSKVLAAELRHRGITYGIGATTPKNAALIYIWGTQQEVSIYLHDRHIIPVIKLPSATN